MKQSISGEFVRFVLVGGVNALLTFGLYALLLLILPYSGAYTVSYVAGIFISYGLNTRFVFRGSFHFKKVVQYPFVYLVQYLAGLGSLYVLVEGLHLDELIASPLTVLVTVPLTFVISRWIIKGRPPSLTGSQTRSSED